MSPTRPDSIVVMSNGPQGVATPPQSVVVCRIDQLTAAALPTELGGGVNFLPDSPQCVSDVAIFSPSHAVTDTALTWTGALGELRTVQLSEALVLPLTVWVPEASIWTSKEGGLDAQAWAMMTVAKTTAIFGKNRLGLRPDVLYRTYTATDEATIDTRCIAASSLSANTALHDVRRLNIYYVQDILQSTSSSYYAFNCWKDGHPEITYMSLNDEVPSYLAHELGHALGLQDAAGHIQPVLPATAATSPFTKDNLMWNESHPDEARKQDTFTLGQVFRMSLDVASWVNRAASGPLRNGRTKICGQTISAGACPALWTPWK